MEAEHRDVEVEVQAEAIEVGKIYSCGLKPLMMVMWWNVFDPESLLLQHRIFA